MKLRLITIFSFIIVLAAACRKDYLDQVPDDVASLEKIFTNKNNTEGWFYSLYTGVKDFWDVPYEYSYTGMTDEVEFANWPSSAISFVINANSGAVSPDWNYGVWQGNYQIIRRVSVFLENVDNCKELLDQPNGAEIVKQYKAEAKFMRAYCYWATMKEVGPVPILPTRVGTIDDNYQIPRSPWDTCVAFVMREMQDAYADLANIHVLASGQPDVAASGRITKPIATAIMSQIALYHASPLFNGNSELADFKNLDGTQLINQTYDASKWTKAAALTKKAIEENEAVGKGLYYVSDANPFRAAYLSVSELFWKGWQTEGVWTKYNGGFGTIIGAWERHAAPVSSLARGWNGIGVLQELVDDFRMDDGTDIANDSRYNENTTAAAQTAYYAAGTNTMYTNREPRFYAYVTFQGSKIPVTPESGSTWVYFHKGTKNSKDQNPRDWPKTGYTARKNLFPGCNFQSYTTQDRPTMLIRMAELYLNHAEALNEADPGNPEVLVYLNKVRTRAGLPELTSGSQEELRKQIHLERRLELCFENAHRYFDVRRWKIADKPEGRQYGDFTGMNMDAGTSITDLAFYQRTVISRRSGNWQRKRYFFPFGQNEMDRNKQLVQFPGY